MASMAELARQLLGMTGDNVGGVSADRYMESMDRSPYGTGVPLEIGYGEQDQMSPIDAAALVTGGVPVVGDITGLAADVDMYMRDPESRNIPNYLLSAAGALPFLPAASQVRKGIKAYHGSPHDFPPVRELQMPDGALVYQSMDDAIPYGSKVIKEHPLGRFNMSKIGTGEGAQAYGHGLYFADSEDVARGYRDTLTPRDLDYEEELMRRYKNAESQQNYGKMEMYERAMQHDTPADFREIALDADYDDDYRQMATDMAEEIEDLSPDLGAMYQVDIDANPDELLDWDKPLSEQSDFVREKMQSLGFEDNKKALKEYDDALLNALFKDSDTPLPKQPSDISGNHLYYRSAPNATDPAEATKTLYEKGIKGIKYKDGFSRGSKGGSSNYVIFDDRLISIAKKYGIAIPAAAAILSRQTGEDTSQSYQEEI